MLALPIFLYILSFSSGSITVTTYNLWNVMFNWDIRKYRIARMIKEENSDIIGFQEVRFDSLSGRSQITDLQSLLPDFKWTYFSIANNISKKSNSMNQGWNSEGIGILSRYPIQSMKKYVLPFQYGPDTNRRIVVHTKIQIDKDSSVEVFVLHLSYVRQQQCENIAAFLKILEGIENPNIVIIGDLNIYKDFEWPVQLLMSSADHPSEGCPGILQSQLKNRKFLFRDAWTSAHGARIQGLTFSNMPSPGLQSRPDRILTSSNMQILSTILTGDGSFYKDKYSGSIKLHRIRSVIYNAYLAYKGISGYSCVQDCGPKGSCRCGICVKGGNSNNCDIPNCSECNKDVFLHILYYCIILSFILLHIFFAVLNILIVGSNFRKEAVYSILGINCCLCNPNIFKRQSGRKNKFLQICLKWPLFRLPPFDLFIASFSCFLLVLYITQRSLSDLFTTVNKVMEEEYFPSDHLMLSTVFDIK